MTRIAYVSGLKTENNEKSKGSGSTKKKTANVRRTNAQGHPNADLHETKRNDLITNQSQMKFEKKNKTNKINTTKDRMISADAGQRARHHQRQNRKHGTIQMSSFLSFCFETNTKIRKRKRERSRRCETEPRSKVDETRRNK